MHHRILEFTTGPGKAGLAFIGSSDTNAAGIIICDNNNNCDYYVVPAMAHFYTGNWYHIAFTYDATTKVGRIYKDGEGMRRTTIYFSHSLEPSAVL